MFCGGLGWVELQMYFIIRFLNRIQIEQNGEISPKRGSPERFALTILGPKVPASKMKGYILWAASTVSECVGNALDNNTKGV